MYKILIDTCVWLDLAKDPSQHRLLDLLVNLINSGEVELILPDIVRKEFGRNKERLIKENSQSLASNFRRVLDSWDQLGDPNNKDSVTEQLRNASNRIPQLSEEIASAISYIEDIFSHSKKIRISDLVKIRAVQRGVDRKAPFHKSKNSINDTLLLECFIEVVRKEKRRGVRFIFVTHNKNDFGNPIDEREPHPDFSKVFSKVKCRYETKLSKALNKIRPDLITDSMIESELFYSIRPLSDLQRIENELYQKVWFARHEVLKKNYSEDILIESENYAAEIILKYGKENLSPMDQFEWGMLNGKLSAIRWVIGSEWDMLDS